MSSPTVQRRRRRRVLAVATAGLALCIGVSVTSLAAWQQNFGVSSGANSIGSSLLQIELSIDGGSTWTAASISTNNSISFSGSPTLLTPGDTVYASVLLRAGAGSRGANVTLSGGTVSDTLLSALTYAARFGVGSASCTSSLFSGAGTSLVAAGSGLGSGSGSTAFAVPAAPSSSVAGTPVGVCLAVSLPSSATTAVSGLTTSPVWQFDATSN